MVTVLTSNQSLALGKDSLTVTAVLVPPLLVVAT